MFYSRSNHFKNHHKPKSQLEILTEDLPGEILWCAALYVSHPGIRAFVKQSTEIQALLNPDLLDKKLDELRVVIEPVSSKESMIDRLNKLLDQESDQHAVNLINQAKILFNLIKGAYEFYLKELVTEDEDHTTRNIVWLQNRSGNEITYIGTSPRITILATVSKWCVGARSISDLELFLRKTKDQWSTKKFRDKNKERKQCTFVLKTKSISQLEKLCDRHSLNKSKMLEKLIENACEELGIIKKPPRM